MHRKKIGLALGSGVARGLAHIGVLSVLGQENIPIDFIAGTSIGAAIGAVYAHSRDVSQLKRWIIKQSRRKLAAFIDLALPKTGFIKGDRIKELLSSFLEGETQFRDLGIPFACIATDIDTGEEVVFHDGSVIDAVRASISLPGIFTVTELGGRYLVDGGLVNPVPVNVTRQMGADFIIAVNVIPEVSLQTSRRQKTVKKAHQEPNLVHIITQSLNIGNYSLVRASLAEADIIIEPELPEIGAGDFHRAAECIRQGELATQTALPEIRRKLKA